MTKSKLITPHLWFDNNAGEAGAFYTNIFPDSKVTHTSKIRDVPTPSGGCDIFNFELGGHPFMAINAGPIFKLNPSISLVVGFDSRIDENARKNLDILWQRLSEGGTPLMPLDKYPFSERYGWIQDRYGLSWQLILSKTDREARPMIVPSLMFVGAVAGRAEEAVDFYSSIFDNSRRGIVARYGQGQESDKEGTVMFSDFVLNGQWFAAMDSARNHDFSFNEAFSLLIPCENQSEIDYYSERLSADPKSEQCGWLKDKFGVSWQVWPIALGEMMTNGTPEQVARITKAFLQMKRYNIAKLESAYREN